MPDNLNDNQMNEEMLKIAQDEYQRQFREWTENRPKKSNVYDEIQKLLKKYEKLKDDFTISPCPKCGCTTVISKNDNWVCERCGKVIV